MGANIIVKLLSFYFFFQNTGDDFRHLANAFFVGVDAVALHLVAIVGKQLVEVDDLQAILLSHLLLDGDDAVGDDGVVDVPCRFEGGDGGTEENLRSFGLDLACFLDFLLRGGESRTEGGDHLLQVLLELGAMLPVLRLGVVGA